MTRTRNLRMIAATLAVAGVFAVPAIANAETDRPTKEPTTDVRKTDVRVTDRDHDVEALHMKCAQLEPGVAAVECAWRPATHPRAVGYQLWRIIDRGHRELVWRGGLDATSNVSRVPADASVARYAVLAVNENGRIVGRSRVQTVTLRLPDIDNRPVDPKPVDIRPIDVKVVDATDVKPATIRFNTGSRIALLH